MTRAFSAISRIAALVCSRLTTIDPSTTGLMRSHMRGNRLLPPAPSTNDGFQSLNTWGDPIEKDRAAGAAVSGSAPHTLIPERSALSRIACTDRPHTPPARGRRQQRHGIGGPAHFV